MLTFRKGQAKLAWLRHLIIHWVSELIHCSVTSLQDGDYILGGITRKCHISNDSKAVILK